MDYNQMSLKMHEENHGKLEVVSKVAINDRDDLNVLNASESGLITVNINATIMKIAFCLPDVVFQPITSITIAPKLSTNPKIPLILR